MNKNINVIDKHFSVIQVLKKLSVQMWTNVIYSLIESIENNTKLFPVHV